MISVQEVLIHLDNRDLEFVLIGGIAMRKYGSPRATFDVDVAIGNNAVDTAFQALLEFESTWFVQSVVDEPERKLNLIRNLESVDETLRQNKPGFGRFLISPKIEREGWIEVDEIPGFRTVDLVWDHPIPFSHLLRNAKGLEYGEVEFATASPEDLLEIKKATYRQRNEKRDKQDIEFLENLLEESE